jgi:predicted ATPase
VPAEHASEVQRLFDELVDLDTGERVVRLRREASNATVAGEVASLLAAADRGTDFLGILGGRPSSDAGAQPPPLVAGRYRLERHVAAGAMGDVHLARDLQLDRPVAIKFLRHASREARDDRARFVAEARTAARLDHPNVATVHDVGEDDDGRLFIAMAYYPGETLRERISRGKLSAEESARIGAEIAGALAAAHGAGIVHRDVKPANVLFDATGAVRLADFGIAKLADGDLTAAGAILGTVAYMSPEQARGDAVEGASDLWSLGVVLFEMLTSWRPFIDQAPYAMLRALIEQEPAPLPDDVDIPSGLRSLVAALLEKDPAQRLRDAADVARLLRRVADGGADDSMQSQAPRAGNLPASLTSFVGRTRELDVARRLLDGSRLLTLTGPGGTGKSRLALQLAADTRERYRGGAWWVPLTEVHDAAHVPSVIASALGLRDLGGQPALDRIISFVQARHTLIVLDNFEHVLQATGAVAELLAKCGELRLLVTSREPLALQGEQELAVPPLAIPTRGDAGARENESVTLFVQRALAVRPDLALDAAALESITEICRRLDGLPLALELAAARARLLSPRAILARLENRLELLRSNATDRPVRHRTMRQVIDWSYVLLGDAERALLNRLATFVGGISLEGAEAVAPPPAAGLRRPVVLDLLESLCSKSLLRVEESFNGEPRFAMLETVREFAMERLHAVGDADAAVRAHRTYFLSFAERAAAELRGPSQAEWLNRLERDYANFRAALEAALDSPRFDASPGALVDAARIAAALDRLWFTRGPLLEGSDYFRRIIASLDTQSTGGSAAFDVALRARLFGSAARIAAATSNFGDAAILFERALVLQRELYDRSATARALNDAGWVRWIVGDLAGAEEVSTEAMSIHREMDNALGEALSLNNLAWIASIRGELGRAEEYFARAVALHARHSDARAAAMSAQWLGVIVGRRGNLRRAIELYEESLRLLGAVMDPTVQTLNAIRILSARHQLEEPGDHVGAIERTHLPVFRALGRKWPLAYTLSELGGMLRDHGALARARQVLEEAVAVRRATGGRDQLAAVLRELALTCHEEGDRERARQLLRQALEEAVDFGEVPAMIDCLDAASSMMKDERVELAAALVRAADAAREQLGFPAVPRDRARHEQLRHSLAAALDPARAVERVLSIDEAAEAARAALVAG